LDGWLPQSKTHRRFIIHLNKPSFNNFRSFTIIHVVIVIDILNICQPEHWAIDVDIGYYLCRTLSNRCKELILSIYDLIDVKSSLFQILEFISKGRLINNTGLPDIPISGMDGIFSKRAFHFPFIIDRLNTESVSLNTFQCRIQCIKLCHPSPPHGTCHWALIRNHPFFFFKRHSKSLV